MDPFFFRVEHNLLKSEAFKQLNGSAIKVYLVIGLYSDFGTGWAYPSIRTIAKQSGLSRQTVLNAIEELVNLGMLATSKSTGRSTAYRILQNTPVRPSSKDKKQRSNPSNNFSVQPQTGPEFLEVTPPTVLNFGTPQDETGPFFESEEAQFWAEAVPESGPKQYKTNNKNQNDNVPTIEVPGTPFLVSLTGVLSSSLPMKDVLVQAKIAASTADQIVRQYDSQTIIRVILNSILLNKTGKLQNAAGYIRMGVEKAYDLLPQMAKMIEARRQKLEAEYQSIQAKERKRQEVEQLAMEEAAINMVIENMNRDELDKIIRRAVNSLPETLVRRNPSITNPLIRARVYELINRTMEDN